MFQRNILTTTLVQLEFLLVSIKNKKKTLIIPPTFKKMLSLRSYSMYNDQGLYWINRLLSEQINSLSKAFRTKKIWFWPREIL